MCRVSRQSTDAIIDSVVVIEYVVANLHRFYQNLLKRIYGVFLEHFSVFLYN